MRSYDATDVQLLRALADAPRSTFVALAERLGLSRNTVQARMSRLEGALGSMERRVDPAGLGYPLTAFIAVHVQQKALEAIVEEVAAIPEVLQAHGLSGPIDLLVHVVATDAAHLFRIDADILAIEGVERTETSLSMGEMVPFRLRPLLDRAAE
ncbi:Lrp/AsnC family transcriptional regulator [Glaciibacter flavus]|uniref:Lrp/AsnC family transcriptional regulator n=1 Tax=Orlajensenia flava TaxID=2565934 RepID=A0A4S4FYI0_9MICO|nr:Lrp/AsnC family transcriptional regulator [Glaciibacter flavus]THG35508.1 Lrp/AsnC family transcriptional regulator [Glaciibacter flavus]